MSKLKVFVAITIFFLGGCSLPGAGVAIIPTQMITNDGITSISKKYSKAVCEEIETGCTEVGIPRDGSWLAHINTCQLPDKDDDRCKVLRNIIINELILISDHNYHSYEGGMLAGRAKNNFYTGALRTSLETAGALITVASSTKILSGLAALTGTLQESGDKEFFFDNTIDALIIQMRADRTLSLVPLVGGRKKEYDDYSIETAIGDITNYYRAGTLASAIVSISKSASASQTSADKELEKAKSN